MTSSRLGPYVLERELGSGAMGSVFAARVEGRVPGLAPGTRVAVKRVHSHLFDRPGHFKRFLREAEVGRRIRSPNVVRVLDYDALEGTHFLVMEYVEGQTLGSLLEELERVPEGLCRHLGAEIAAGLEAVHAAGAVHRDLKPENVLVTPAHDVKLMDLGVARVIDERLSETGAFIGSVEYAAPEQFTGRADHRADLHALGVLLYELACGHHPFRAGTFAEVMRNVRELEPRPLCEREPSASPLLGTLIERLLAKAPDDRLQSAAEVRAILEEGEEGAWWQTRVADRVTLATKTRRRLPVGRDTAVHGRSEELAQLRGLFDQVAAGDGRVLLVRGEAGVGKSRLMDEFVRRLDDDGEEFHFLFGSYPPGGAATGVGALSDALREHLGDGGARRHLGVAPLLAPAFDALLRGEAAPADTDSLTRDGLQTAFVQALRALSSERPTLLLVEDLHNAPRSGQALFTALAIALRRSRVLLVGSYRRDGDTVVEGELGRFDHVSRIELSRLGPADLAAMLGECLQSDVLAARLSHVIAVRSDGNPFFAFEIVRGLREGGFIRRGDHGTWVSTAAVEGIEVPQSVRDVVQARVAELDEGERELLDVAACYGHRFDPLVVGDALGLDRIPALRTLGRLQRKRRLVHARGAEFEFDHHQIQETLYAALSEPLRREYHALLGETLERRLDAAERAIETLPGRDVVRLAHHLLEGGREERGARYVGRASQILRDGFLPSRAARLLECALDAPGVVTGRERVRLALQLCSALDVLARHADQERWARDACAEAEGEDDPACDAAAHMALGIALLRLVRHTEAEEEFERALAAAEEAEADSTRASILLNHAISLQSRGSLARAGELYQTCLPLCRSLGKRASVAAVLGNLGSLAYMRGDVDEARRRYAEAAELHRELGNRQGLVTTSGNLAVLHKALGETDRAIELHKECIEASQEIGYRRGEAMNAANLGVALQEQGRLARAAHFIERSIEINEETGYRRNHGNDLNNLSLVRMEQGLMSEARRLAERGREFGQAEGLPIVRGYALRTLVRIAYECDEWDGLVVVARESMEHASRIEFRRLEPWTHFDLGEVLVETDPDAAAVEWRICRDQARTQRIAGAELLAQSFLAAVDPTELDVASETFERLAGDATNAECRQARFALWRATGDENHLRAANALLEQAVVLAESDPDTMRRGLRSNRRILDGTDGR